MFLTFSETSSKNILTSRNYLQFRAIEISGEIPANSKTILGKKIAYVCELETEIQMLRTVWGNTTEILRNDMKDWKIKWNFEIGAVQKRVNLVDLGNFDSEKKALAVKFGVIAICMTQVAIKMKTTLVDADNQFGYVECAEYEVRNTG